MPAPIPPFTRETAIVKVRMAEDAWNSRDPHRVSLAYTEDSRWRNRAEFLTGRAEIVAFLSRKWQRELDYRLIKEMWAFGDDRIAVRFAYEWHDDSGTWFRSYGNENCVARRSGWEGSDNQDGNLASRHWHDCRCAIVAQVVCPACCLSRRVNQALALIVALAGGRPGPRLRSSAARRR